MNEFGAFLLPSCQQCSYSYILFVNLCLTSLIWRNQAVGLIFSLPNYD